MINEYIETCGYNIGELKPYVFLIPKSSKIKYKLDIDNVINSYITSISYTNLYKLNATSVVYNSVSSYGGRFTNESSLEITINEVNGYQFDYILKQLTDEYYVLFETKLNDRFVLSVEFATYFTYSKQLTENNHSLTITFNISQNIPSLQLKDNIMLNNYTVINEIPCEYTNFDISSLEISTSDNTIVTNDIISVNKDNIKRIDFIKNSVSFNETYVDDQYSYSVSFKIPLKNYTNYLNYTLLEFKKNLYTCYIKTSLNNAFVIPKLFPSYSIETSETESTLNVITITLSTISNSSTMFESTITEMEDIIDNNSGSTVITKWMPIYKFDSCVLDNTKAHTLLGEFNFKGIPTGNYACLDGFLVFFKNFNIIETYSLDETKYGFDISWEDNNCGYYSECTMVNLPSSLTFNEYETKVITVNSTCNWTIMYDDSNLWQITPTSGNIGEQEITFKYLKGDNNESLVHFNFEDNTTKSIKLIGKSNKLIRYVEDGTICSEIEIIPDEKCEKWVEIDYNPSDQSTFICDKGNLYKKKQLYKSDNCDGNFYAVNQYISGDLIESNSSVCTSQGETIWVEIPNEFICEKGTNCEEWRTVEYDPNDQTTFICYGYNRYSKQDLYISDNCDDNWVNTGIYREGELVEENSVQCGYYEPTEDSDKLKFSWGSGSLFNFKVNNRNIQTTENPYSHTFKEMGITTSAVSCKNMFNAAFNSGGKLLTFDNFPIGSIFNEGYGMFAYQTILTICNMPYQTVGNTDFRYMFRDCSSLTKINFDGWRLNTDKYMVDEMFKGCTALTEISLKNANQTFIDMIKDALFQAGLISQVNLITN